MTTNFNGIILLEKDASNNSAIRINNNLYTNPTTNTVQL